MGQEARLTRTGSRMEGLNDMLYFVELAECGGLAAAGRALGLLRVTCPVMLAQSTVPA